MYILETDLSAKTDKSVFEMFPWWQYWQSPEGFPLWKCIHFSSRVERRKHSLWTLPKSKLIN